MKYILLILTINLLLSANEPIHSSISIYHEKKSFTNSKQKVDGTVDGVGADIHHNNSEYKVAYEKGFTNTKKPPLKKDLETKKLFLKYRYTIGEDFMINVNYIKVLKDNIAITAGGKVYGGGLSYIYSKNITSNFTQYYSDYEDFDVYQSDFRVDYKTKIDSLKIKLSSIFKYISLDDKKRNDFTKNANKDYSTIGLKLHSHYKTYHLGAGAYFGKRVFAVMNDGFKLQHHSMEFDRTYAIGVGKSFYDFVLRVQYIYQRATELPSKTQNVKVSNLRVILNYKF